MKIYLNKMREGQIKISFGQNPGSRNGRGGGGRVPGRAMVGVRATGREMDGVRPLVRGAAERWGEVIFTGARIVGLTDPVS